MTNLLDVSRLSRLPAQLRRRHGRASRRRDEAGYVTVVISIMIPALFIGLAATAVDTSRWYLEGERLQEAADAAALAGVPYLPQDMTSARARAIEVAARNGFDDSDPDVVVTVSQGERNTQLRVTISSKVTNQFGQIIGVDSTGISRTAVADFTGPAPMGSPCNTFGTEPPAGAGAVSPAPTGSAIGAIRPGNCPQNPMMWATVEGPDTPKQQGDRYSTRICNAGEDGCSGSTNSEYPEGSDKKGERGYFWVIKVQPAMVNRPIQLQLYDPAFVLTGQFCGNNTSAATDQLPNVQALDNSMNPYVTTDGKQRYANVDTFVGNGINGAPSIPFCTGDNYPGYSPPASNPASPNLTTTFLVREQTDTMDPTQAPVVSGCAKQYGAFTTYPTYDNLKSGQATYNSQLAQVFHNWTSLCTFTPTRAGDYYLQVRTNKSYAFGAGQLVRTVPAGEYPSISAKNGDGSPTGYGSNSFAIRAVAPAGLERGVAVSGWDRMPIYANSEAATTIFPLIRVLPGAAGQYINFSFFDAGDAATTATVKVLLPTDAPTPVNPFPGGCTAQGGAAGSGQTLVGCTATGITKALNNGKVQTMMIPIPPDYTCDPSVFTNCWYRVQISFSSGSVHDVTTWDAQIAGDPVRLIE